MHDHHITILQIEDNPGDAKLIREMLKNGSGIEYVFREAETIEDGYSVISDGGADLVLLDLGLPGSTGIATLEKLLRIFERTHPPVIVMTGIDNEEIGMEAVKQGAQDYLVKNKIDSELLGRSIRYALERNELLHILQQAHDDLEKKIGERTSELVAAVRTLKTEVRERKKAEAERESISRQVNQLQKMESLGTLAGGIAHDFNNILSGIIGYADLSLDDVSPDSRLGHNLYQIIQSGDRAKKLIQQILNFSRSNPVEKTPQYLTPIIREATDLLRAGMPATIFIKSTLVDDTEPVLADPTQIHEILMNLCTNAKQAMTDEKGCIEILHEEAYFTSDIAGRAGTVSPGRYSVITVRDNGCGMDEKTLLRVFDPFFTTKAPGKGTGMGMAVLYGIVQNHGGTVTVESSPGTGTTFKVFLPKCSSVIISEASSESLIEYGDERIMCIDDEELLCAMIKDMLGSLGYTVSVFDDSMHALDTFRERPYDFDLIISDLTMPFLTGTDLSKEIHKIRPDIPFILYTGNDITIDKEKTCASGVDTFLQKPFRKKDLACKIRSVFRQRVSMAHS